MGKIKNTSHAAVNNFSISHIVISTFTGKTLEVTNELVSLTLFESIETLMYGNITLQNRANITGLVGNFTGQEIISVEFCSNTGTEGAVRATYKKVFRCSSISYSNTANPNSPQTNLLFNLRSPLETIDDTNRISNCYTDVTPSDIILSVLNATLGNDYNALSYNMENTNNIANASGDMNNITFPISKPLDIITKVKNIAISSEYDSSNFLFFENRDSINFISMGNLKTNDYKFTFRIPVNSQVFNAGSNDFVNIHTVNAFWLSNPDGNYAMGTFGSNVMATSILNKSFEYYQYDREELNNTKATLNEQEIDPDTGNPIDTTLSTTESIADGEDFYNLNLLFSSDSIYTNLSGDHGNHKGAVAPLESAKNNSKRILLVADPNTDITCGDIVNVDIIDLNNADRNKSSKNTNLSGKWIVLSIKHNISLTEYTSEYTLVSDSNVRS